MESLLGNKESFLDNLSSTDVELLNFENNSAETGIYIFFSFDLVDSTKLKTEEKTSSLWPHMIFRFYEMIYTELKDRIPQITVWKYLGDEILLYVSINELENDTIIYSIPEITFNIQSKVSKDLQEMFNLEKLYIKSTIWLAAVKNIKSEEFDIKKLTQPDKIYKNMKMALSVGNQNLPDFLGPDMDIGFRIAKFAYHHKVVISADFAYLLFRMKKPRKMKSIDDKMKIVSFEILKGVWENKYYPIIWYYPDWDNEQKDFRYADHKENPIIENILGKRIYALNKLEQVFGELNIGESIENLIEECVKIISTTKEINILPSPI